MTKVDVDSLIMRILSAGTPGGSLMNTVKEAELIALCTVAKQAFLSQPALLEVEPPMKICGDTHGHYADVLRLFDRGGFPPLVNYLFLGDYVDRGHYNIEVVSLFMCYKTKYPLNFFLLRGNHECAAINRVYGFYEECIRKYQSVRLWQTYQDVFASMPYLGLVGGRILCMHGGISPKMKSMEQLRHLTRPADFAASSIHMDILWSDPDCSTKGWVANTRGVGYAFGEDVLKKTVQLLDIDLVVRAHQVVQDGYEFFGKKRLVTVFSAPYYCGQFDNAAAMMNVDEDLVCTFTVIRPSIKPIKISALANV